MLKRFNNIEISEKISSENSIVYVRILYLQPKFVEMSKFQFPIPQHIKQGMTLLPTPMHTKGGDIVPYPEHVLQRYADMREMKQRVVVRYEESLDADFYPDHTRYVMTVLYMSADADLEIIFAAARHLGMVGHYDIKRVYKEELDDRYEKNCLMAYYQCPTERVDVDYDTYLELPVVTGIEQRRKIWEGLFEAAGYRVEYGKVLNARYVKI